MAIEAGKVTIVVGKFVAVGSDGSQRVLKVGDIVYDGEIVKSNGGTQIEITNGDKVYSGGSDAFFKLEVSNSLDDISEDSIDKEISELIGENSSSSKSLGDDKAPFEDEPIIDDKTAAVGGFDDKVKAVSGEDIVDDKTKAVSGESESFFYTGGGGGGGSVAARFVQDTTGMDGVGSHAEAMLSSTMMQSGPATAAFNATGGWSGFFPGIFV